MKKLLRHSNNRFLIGEGQCAAYSPVQDGVALLAHCHQVGEVMVAAVDRHCNPHPVDMMHDKPIGGTAFNAAMPIALHGSNLVIIERFAFADNPVVAELKMAIRRVVSYVEAFVLGNASRASVLRGRFVDVLRAARAAVQSLSEVSHPYTLFEPDAPQTVKLFFSGHVAGRAKLFIRAFGEKIRSAFFACSGYHSMAFSRGLHYG